MKKSKVEQISIFANISSPFSVLNDVCTGTAELQVILVETKSGRFIVECIEEMGYSCIIFSGNEIKLPNYKETKAWEEQVNKLFNCNISDLIFEDAKKNIDLSEVEYKLSFGPRILSR
jgi:hypothetical protein